MWNNSVIVSHILENFSNTELEKLKEVCSMWKKVAEQIIKNRIMILRKSIPYEILDKGITNPEVILPFLEMEDETNIEFITELYEFVAGNVQDQNSSRSKLTTSPSKERIISTQVAIFPRVSGIRLLRFSFSWNESLVDENIISYISNITHVEEKEIKCLLLFINGDILDINFDTLPMCSIGGIFSSLASVNLYRGIAISGKNVQAVTIPLLNEEFDSAIETMSYVDKLEEHKIDGNKCIAFLFTDRHYPDCCILSKFKNMFPDAPILFYNFSLVFGKSSVFGLDEQQYYSQQIFTSESNETIGLLLLLWYK